MCIGFVLGRWCWIGSESLGLFLDWSLGPRICFRIGLRGVHLGLALDWFWAGIRRKTLIKFSFAHGNKQRRFFTRALGQISPFVPRAKKDLDEGFRANFVKHYWIGFCYCWPLLDWFWGGRGHYWIGCTLSETQLVQMHHWIGCPKWQTTLLRQAPSFLSNERRTFECGACLNLTFNWLNCRG